MTRDAAATRLRILDAASAEFAERGLAGSRIDRISAGAAANVRLLYAHFGSKEKLFETVLERELTTLADTVPVDVDDLPGWVGRLFDYHREHPSSVRISLWRELERPDLGPDHSPVYAEKVGVMAASVGAADSAVDLLVLLYGMAQAWFFTPLELRGADGSDPRSDERIAAHRRVLVAAADSVARSG